MKAGLAPSKESEVETERRGGCLQHTIKNDDKIIMHRHNIDMRSASS